MQIENCVALVTGANRGLGKSFVDALLLAGAAKVYAGARNPESVVATDPRVVAVALDVTDKAQVAAVASACHDVTLVINNAGVMHASSVLDADAEVALRSEFDVNVWGTFHMIRAFAPVLARNGGGAIADILSVAAWFAFPHNATYGASKHAALALTEAVRFQLKGQGTQMIAVFSGYIDTDMAAGVSLPKVSPQQVAERTLDAVRSGADHAYADDNTEQTGRILREDRDSYRARVQQMWDDGAFAKK
ncbi:SDR family oxidoreductase [Sphingomonas sp.]|uniref:SDR family oxidoreductase n=1 Tax=Sphingomonas sp. TaxID=28214 RepID=UPI000DB08EFE|nr:SDR family oxidoreductase [Sphingomonas sp.]PZU09267.1 MAG: short-chain dehydrogenase [Sphingomonas sp.]